MLPVNPLSYNSSMLSDTAKLVRNEEEPETEIITYKKRTKKRIVYYDEPVVANNPVPVVVPAVNTEVSSTPPVATETTTTNSGIPGTTTTNSGDGNSSNAGTEASVPEAKKKGWSNAAKGTVIGAVGGAVAGAVINGKNRGKGAIIGGVIGAAGGYILGKKKDKNNTQ